MKIRDYKHEMRVMAIDVYGDEPWKLGTVTSNDGECVGVRFDDGGWGSLGEKEIRMATPEEMATAAIESFKRALSDI